MKVQQKEPKTNNTGSELKLDINGVIEEIAHCGNVVVTPFKRLSQRNLVKVNLSA